MSYRTRAFVPVLLIFLFLAVALLSPDSETADAGPRLDKSRTFRCILWNYKGHDYRFRAQFLGKKDGRVFRVFKTRYKFETDDEFNPGNSANINVTRQGRTIWRSPDALYTDNGWHLYTDRYNLPARGLITVQGIADHGSGGDPECSLTARPT